MSLVGSEIKVMFRYTYLSQKCENVQTYIAQGAAFLTATMSEVLEALWNDQKTRLLAITSTDSAVATWDSLLGLEIGGGLAFAEFPVPAGERNGTRSASGLGNPLNSFSAGGFRQTVGTRVTRPGQKRFPFLWEADVDANSIGATYLALLTAIAVGFTAPIALGSPVAGGGLQPVVVHEPTTRRPTRAVQNITGYVVNPDITSQVSRKKGRGI